ncbi:hypothetical protein [Hymenobacter ruricola]|uniref:Bacterial surface antigen (D15) domain-containing protein n=1 Tax=Hymenobacter ruricola TaxID=2791023 RepID=A0ABS0I3X5_9BACT|nr:hypothetical protein [Hymenobacter ruricola]MBF9221428.1 hypothetical protein [Hymenobacter ruricola]
MVVRSNGDTLRGEIENNFWVDPPKFIHFRQSSSAAAELLRPRQLRAVVFAGGRYFRFERLPIDHAAETRLDRLPQGYHPDVRQDSLLAEVLLEGPAELLRVVRFSATHYLVRRAGQPVLDLSEREYLSPGSGGKLTVTNGNNYRAQLELYFGDCAAASLAARGAVFTPEGLAAVVQAYNEACSAARQPARSWLTQAATTGTASWRVGVVAGARYLRTDNADIPPQLSPCGGLYGEVLLPNRSLALYSEVNLSGFHGGFCKVGSYVQTSGIVNGQPVVTNTPVVTAFDYQALLPSFRLGFRYFYPLPREQQWLLGGGLEAGYVMGIHGFKVTDGPSIDAGEADVTTSRVILARYSGLLREHGLAQAAVHGQRRCVVFRRICATAPNAELSAEPQH